MKRTALLAAALAIAAASARAGMIDLVLTNAYMYAYPGDTVPFDATISSPWWPQSLEYLNTDSSNVDSPLILDDSAFFANFPLYLNPGDSFEATLFDVFVPTGTPEGVYSGYFEIDGGSDVTASDYLGSAVFNLEVGPSSGSSATPEPPSLAMTATVLLLGVMRGLRRRSERVSEGMI